MRSGTRIRSSTCTDTWPTWSGAWSPPQQRAITEVNLSTYVFRPDALLSALRQLTADNVQGEYYLTDCPGVLQKAGERVDALCVLEPSEALSINTTDELGLVEAEMKKR